MRNGRGDGYDGQLAGRPAAAAFDPAKINVVNRAVGGTGPQFISQGHRIVLALLGRLCPDAVWHNDNGLRGLPGPREETERQNPLTNQPETVHTFGWYLRKYIADAKAKGVTPIVCSLVPRNIWRDGKISRPQGSHADWARSVAQSEQAAFLDLHEIIADTTFGEQAGKAVRRCACIRTGHGAGRRVGASKRPARATHFLVGPRNLNDGLLAETAAPPVHRGWSDPEIPCPRSWPIGKPAAEQSCYAR
jgi:hypothetical protein